MYCVIKNEIIMNNIEIRLRVDSYLKQNTELVLQTMGMRMSEAIRIFLMQSVNSEGLPFRPHLTKPNATTIAALKSIEEGEFEELSREELKKYLDEL